MMKQDEVMRVSELVNCGIQFVLVQEIKGVNWRCLKLSSRGRVEPDHDGRVQIMAKVHPDSRPN